MRALANNVESIDNRTNVAFDNRTNVAYIAEAILLEREFIKRHPHTNNVRLTPLGRQNCNKGGVDIPTSDIEAKERTGYVTDVFSTKFYTKRFSRC